MCIFQHSFVAVPNWLKKKATIHLEFSSMVCIQNMRDESFVLSHVCENKLSLEFVKVLKISLRPLPHPHPHTLYLSHRPCRTRGRRKIFPSWGRGAD